MPVYYPAGICTLTENHPRMGKNPENHDRYVKRIVFFVLMALMVMPAIQARFSLLPEEPLNGAFQDAGKPSFQEFTRRSWLDGSFQEEFNNRLEHHIGFRNPLVRINNQLDFSIFNESNAEGVIIGEDLELFEEDYLKEATGIYYAGDSIWIRKAEQLKAVQDTLKSMGKHLAVIFEPGKAEFYPEKWPRKYRKPAHGISNYETMLRQFQQKGVNILDLNAYFRLIRSNASYPLFPQCGTHWSYYGAALAADTTMAYLSRLTGKAFPKPVITRLRPGDTIRHPDYDIGLAMNLVFPVRQPATASFDLEFEHQAPSGTDVLIVGDSFYFNWLNDNIPARTFGSCDFWYYNKNITRCDYTEGGRVQDLDFRQEVMKRDLILIMITGRFNHAFAWNFDEELYNLFFPGYVDPVWKFSNDIRIYEDGFRRMVKESTELGMNLPDRINQEAEYLFYQDYKAHPEKYTERRDLIRLYELGIRGTPEWMEKIREKAKINGITVEEQLRRDAEWLYNEKYGKS